jgi:peptidoglycan-associated lipoprotein
MTRQLAGVMLCSGVAVLAAACATKGFVQEQVSATETRLAERVDRQETQLREALERAAANGEAIAAGEQGLQGLDGRVSEVGALASEAKTRAEVVGEGAHQAEMRLAQRLADRNKYRVVETRVIHFDFDRADIRDEGNRALEEMATALRADANAVVELQGFADPRGSERYNYELARARVEAVLRYFVQRQGIDLRQLRAVALGKVALGAGEKASLEAWAKTRRVDIRLLAPWSSWEDAQSQLDAPAPEPTVTVEAVGGAGVARARGALRGRDRVESRRGLVVPGPRVSRLRQRPGARGGVVSVPPSASPVPKVASLTCLGLGVAVLGVRRWSSVRRPCTAPLARRPIAGRRPQRSTTSSTGRLSRTAPGYR